MAERKGNSWFSEDLQKWTKRRPLLTGISSRGQEQSVDDRATIVCASFSIQRHVSQCFTPHIMLSVCLAHFDIDGALSVCCLVDILVMLKTTWNAIHNPLYFWILMYFWMKRDIQLDKMWNGTWFNPLGMITEWQNVDLLLPE